MKKITDYDFYSVSQEEARKLGPFGKSDKPCMVECYREKSEWRSTEAAKAFYEAGANCCSGSERERYSAIVAQLEAGRRSVSDSCWD